MSAERPTKVNLTSLVFDRFKPTLDLKNTTIESLLRNVAVDYYKPDTLKNVTFFSGRILRKVDDPKKFDPSPFNEINSTSDTNISRYKVWVHDLCIVNDPSENTNVNNQGSIVENIYPSDDTEYGRSLISCLQDYIVTDSELNSPCVGDDVVVTYRDLTNFKHGIITEIQNKTSNGENTINPNAAGGVPVSGSNKPSAAFATATPAANIEESNNDEEIELYNQNGKVYKKVKARKVPSTDGSKQLLIVQMAEDFKKMALDAKADGINLTANSAYRNIDQQIEIFDKRWTIKYAEGRPKILPKDKGGQNELNSVGKTSGTAAIPGGSPHNRSEAVDISIGGGPNLIDKFNTPNYKWLQKNAYKYGFFNTGYKIKKTPEAWHWSYKPSEKGNKNAIINPPKERESE